FAPRRDRDVESLRPDLAQGREISKHLRRLQDRGDSQPGVRPQARHIRIFAHHPPAVVAREHADLRLRQRAAQMRDQRCSEQHVAELVALDDQDFHCGLPVSSHTVGLDIHSLNLLRLAEKAGADFSSVLTVGRLGLYLSDAQLAGYLRETGRAASPEELRGEGFCERFLERAFGAREVVSLDASAYDGATLIHDLNVPLKGEGRFSAVLDFGTLEHVFNFPVAVSNLIAACRDGGHLLHALPANNWCGHGFYQFSPELFFSVYSEARGFVGTQVFL